MTYRVRVSVQQLKRMLRDEEPHTTLDILVSRDLVQHMAERLDMCMDEQGLDLGNLLRLVLAEPEGDQVVHSLVL